MLKTCELTLPPSLQTDKWTKPKHRKGSCSKPIVPPLKIIYLFFFLSIAPADKKWPTPQVNEWRHKMVAEEEEATEVNLIAPKHRHRDDIFCKVKFRFVRQVRLK